MKRLLFFLLVFFLLIPFVAADDNVTGVDLNSNHKYYVDASTGLNGDGSFDNPFSDIKLL